MRKAIFSLVPTPSAEETRTGCAEAFQKKASAEAADVGEDVLGEGAARHFANGIDGRVGFVDVYAGLLVTYAVSSTPSIVHSFEPLGRVRVHWENLYTKRLHYEKSCNSAPCILRMCGGRR